MASFLASRLGYLCQREDALGFSSPTQRSSSDPSRGSEQLGGSSHFVRAFDYAAMEDDVDASVDVANAITTCDLISWFFSPLMQGWETRISLGHEGRPFA